MFLLNKIHIKQFLLFLALFLVYLMPAQSVAQTIKATNIQWKVIDNLVIISYDLPESSDRKEVKVVLRRTSDRSFELVPKTVSGDIGKDNFSGAGKKILWDYKKDVPEGLKGSDYYFELTVRVIHEDAGRDISQKEEKAEFTPRPEFRIYGVLDFYFVKESRIGLENITGGGGSVNYIIPVAKRFGLGTGITVTNSLGEFAYYSGNKTRWSGLYSEFMLRPQVFFTNLLAGHRPLAPYYRLGVALALSRAELDYSNDNSSYSDLFTHFEIPLGAGLSVKAGRSMAILAGIDINLAPVSDERRIEVPEENNTVSVGFRPFASFALNLGLKF